MKLSLGKTFLLILVFGIILLSLILAGTQGIPEPLQVLRIFLGVVFILLVPGFSVQAALFPHDSDLDPLLRAAFSFGLSLGVLPPIFLILNGLGVGVQFGPIAIALTLLVGLCAIIVFFRRRKLPAEQKAQIPVAVDLKGWWIAQDLTSRRLLFFLTLASLTALVSAVFVAREPPAESFTEFYLLDSQGLTLEYPREVTLGDSVDFILGITNRENGPSEYRIVAVQDKNQALVSTEPIILGDGSSWQGILTIRLENPGTGQLVEFLLERTDSPWPYRTLRVWLNVLPKSGPTSDNAPTSLSIRSSDRMKMGFYFPEAVVDGAGW